jgi:hypothetical protein
MKTIIALILVAFGSNSFAGDLPDVDEPTLGRYDLTRAQVAAETAFVALMYIDYRQTLDIRDFCKRRFPGVGTVNADGSVTDGTTVYCSVHETNPGLGKHPSEARIRNYFAGVTIAHIAIAKTLPTEYRPFWQGAGIIMQLSQVIKNKKFGLSVNF